MKDKEEKNLHTILLFLRNAFILILLIGLVACQNKFNESPQSPQFEYIQEFAVSPNQQLVALVVPIGYYSRQVGLEASQIIILDKETQDILYTTEFSQFSPYNLQWFGDNKTIAFMISDQTNYEPQIGVWDLATGQLTYQPFPYKGWVSVK